MTIYVVKEDGSFERFKRSNIKDSLEAMGLDNKTAKSISREIHERNRMSEHEIKTTIFNLLDEIDPDLADRYYLTKKVHVKEEGMQVSGTVLLSEFLMDCLDLGRGEKIDIFHGDKKSHLRAYGFKFKDDDNQTMFMSSRDMKSLDLKRGDQVGICKHARS